MTRKLNLLALILLTAFAAFADETQPVLSTDGSIYTADSTSSRLRVVRRIGNMRTHLLVPTTEDDATESQARLMWDIASSSLFVVWNRTSVDGERLLVARLDYEGKWSKPAAITTDSQSSRLALEAVLTRSTETSATFVHAVWWSMGADPVAEYALVAFEGAEHVSTSLSDLNSLAALHSAQSHSREPMKEVLHPPLAMARTGDSVDVLFGADQSTAVTRLRITPKPVPNARIWKPVGRSGERLPNAGLASNSREPVQAMISKGRVILFTPESTFRFVIYDEGKWSPERIIHLDENVTSDQLERELRRTVEHLRASEPQGIRQ